VKSVKLMRKASRYILDGNLKGLILAASRTITPGVYRRGRAYIYELEHLSDNVLFPETYEFRRTEDINAMVEFGLDKRMCEKRLKAGDWCFAGYKGAKIVSAIWGHKGPYYVRGMGYWHRSSQDDRYVYGALTKPDERGKGLFRALKYLISKELLESTSGKITALVDAENTVSIKTNRNMGYREVKVIDHTTLFWIKKTNVRHLGTNNVEQRIFMVPPSDVYVI
jgi:RimJ/RimL family protein N-acetyltransferase